MKCDKSGEKKVASKTLDIGKFEEKTKMPHIFSFYKYVHGCIIYVLPTFYSDHN